MIELPGKSSKLKPNISWTVDNYTNRPAGFYPEVQKILGTAPFVDYPKIGKRNCTVQYLYHTMWPQGDVVLIITWRSGKSSFKMQILYQKEVEKS